MKSISDKKSQEFVIIEELMNVGNEWDCMWWTGGKLRLFFSELAIVYVELFYLYWFGMLDWRLIFVTARDHRIYFFYVNALLGSLTLTNKKLRIYS